MYAKRVMKVVCAAALGVVVVAGCSEEDGETGPDNLEIASDAVVRGHDGYAYVLEKFGADNVMKIDPTRTGAAGGRLFVVESDFQSGLLETVGIEENAMGALSVDAVVYQQHLGDNWNPSDIEFVSATKAYVSNQDQPEITVWNPTTGEATGHIDIADYTFNPDSNASPYANQMVLVGATLYVHLQRRDGWVPGASTLILAVNTQTDSIVAADTLTCQFTNGYDMVHADGALYVSNPGSSLSTGDGAIERIDLSTREVTTVITETDLGGSPNQIVHKSGTRFYVQSYEGWQDVQVVEIDAATGEVVATLPGITDAFGGICYDEPSGKLYVGERGTGVSGVLVFENNVRTSGPLTSTGSLPPASIAVVR
jgi:hypothetical protein